MEEPIRLDGTASAARVDRATVTASGRRIEAALDGVRTVQPVVHVDHRGRVFEVFPGPNDFWTDPVVYCYAFTVRPLLTKGWGLHREKDDRYTLINGELVTVLFDARVDSPTHGQSQTVVLSTQGTRSLRIPAGVWHLNVNVADEEAILVNHPTKQYVHDQPDRLLLPWDTAEIPVDVAALFPTQLRAARCETPGS